MQNKQEGLKMPEEDPDRTMAIWRAVRPEFRDTPPVWSGPPQKPLTPEEVKAKKIEEAKRQWVPGKATMKPKEIVLLGDYSSAEGQTMMVGVPWGKSAVGDRVGGVVLEHRKEQSGKHYSSSWKSVAARRLLEVLGVPRKEEPKKPKASKLSSVREPLRDLSGRVIMPFPWDKVDEADVPKLWMYETPPPRGTPEHSEYTERRQKRLEIPIQGGGSLR